MTETETRYAQIEKEALACECFSDYILGKTITIETDHKPLVPLLSTKRLDNIPPGVLHFRLRLMSFDYSIIHTPGKLLYAADILSRAPQTHSEEAPKFFPNAAILLRDRLYMRLVSRSQPHSPEWQNVLLRRTHAVPHS